MGPNNNRNLTAGHAHNDCLSFELSINGDDIITNRGTFTYADKKKRNTARKGSSNNVCVIDKCEINTIEEEFPFYLKYK